MKNWKNVLITPETKIKDTIKIIDLNSLKIALVINQNQQLIGTVTDGDIRRAILNGINLDDPVEKVMHKQPITITKTNDKNKILNIMKKNKLNLIPVLDEYGCVIGIEQLENLIHIPNKDNWVVLMAGGQGIRLKPLTDHCPKPMLSIGNKPVLETILNQFIEQGFHHFCISVNYLADQIKSYFGNGSKWGVKIKYLHEEKKLGTAGSLSLFIEETKLPIIVMNSDILTKVNFDQLVTFHLEHHGDATIAVRNFDYQIPYGVVKVNNERLVGFDEKPIYTSFINAGIYVINPSVLKKIPVNTYFDINQLFEIMLKNQNKIFVFPIREYWIDIGELADFQRANSEYEREF